MAGLDKALAHFTSLITLFKNSTATISASSRQASIHAPQLIILNDAAIIQTQSTSGHGPLFHPGDAWQKIGMEFHPIP